MLNCPAYHVGALQVLIQREDEQVCAITRVIKHAAKIGANSTDVYSNEEITEKLASIERIPCLETDKIQC